jgi:hypothetical protein
MLKIIGFSLISILLFITSVTALEWEKTCSDSQTLNYYMNFTSCEGNNCTIYNISQTKLCKYGCENTTDSCKPNTLEGYGIIILILVVIAVLIIIFIKVV